MTSISILVVDDSVVVRRLLSNVLDEVPDIEVVGTAANGRIALAKVPYLNPDLVLLDVEMPVMGGLEALWRMCCTHPDIPVVMFSAMTERSASGTLDALELGAADYVTKPSNAASLREAMESVRDQLVPRARSLCRGRSSQSNRRAIGRAARRGAGSAEPPTAVPAETQMAVAESNAIVLVGASTGGPDAVASVLSALPATLPVPVLVVQHMPKMFTRLFAERLDRICALDVQEARDGDRVEPGRVLVAPGDYHLRLRGRAEQVTVALDQGTPENFCRPAVDVLFRAAAQTYGAGCLAVVLTGMGADGMRGARAIVDAGGQVIVQDEASSVVWGMPGAVVAAGLASAVLPLSAIASTVAGSVHSDARAQVVG